MSMEDTYGKVQRYVQEELDYLSMSGFATRQAGVHQTSVPPDEDTMPNSGEMLEGFAHLTARIRFLLDEQESEFQSDFLNTFWRSMRIPVPAYFIAKISNPAGAETKIPQLKRCSRVKSLQPQAGPVIFSTCRELHVLPWEVESSLIDNSGAGSCIECSINTRGVSLVENTAEPLCLYLDAPMQTSLEIYRALFSSLKRVTVLSDIDGELWVEELALNSLEPLGFDRSENLSPFEDFVFEPWGLVQDYYMYPLRFMFVGVGGIETMNRMAAAGKFSIRFELTEKLNVFVPLGKPLFQLNCTPVVNMFSWQAEPLSLVEGKQEYPIVPAACDRDMCHIVEVTGVSLLSAGASKARVLNKYNAFNEMSTSWFYASYPAFNTGDPSLSIRPGTQTKQLPCVASTDVLCVNADLPGQIRGNVQSWQLEGENSDLPVTQLTDLSNTVTADKIQNDSACIMALAELKASTLMELQGLKKLLTTMNRHLPLSPDALQLHEITMSEIVSLHKYPQVRYQQGSPLFGWRVTVLIDRKKPVSNGSLFLLESVLKHVYSVCAGINSFCDFEFQELEYEPQ